MNKFTIISLVIFLTTILSCSDEQNLNEKNAVTQDNEAYLNLGKKLENPYSVTNMKRALDSVKAKMKTAKTSSSFSDFEIETSHLYVKIEPKDAIQEALLKQDTTQVLSDYPLDYELPEEALDQVGTKDINKIGAYYVAVPKDHVFPEGIKTEVLENLYIPEQDPYFENVSETGRISKSSVANKEDLLGNLLIASYTLTHNEKQLGIDDQATAKSAWWIFGKKWRPSGRITMYDNTLGRDVPVEGAQVLIRQWFTVDKGITDGNGYFSTGTVRGEARYVLQWERYEYSIRSGWFGQAETRSNYMKNQAWNFNITGQEDLYYATIHQAAHDYYYKDILGLQRPQQNGFWRRQMKIAACQKSGASVHLNQLADWGILPAVYLYAWGATSESVYGTTIHELTHSAHYEMNPIFYNSLVWKAYIEPEAWLNDTDKYKSAKRTLESWAVCVEIALTNLRYQRLGNPNFQYKSTFLVGSNFQQIALTNSDTDNNFYTSAFFDLTDNFNQRQEFFWISNLPQDRASGFTIEQIQNIIRVSTSWGEVKGQLRSKYPNTATLTDELLSNWQ